MKTHDYFEATRFWRSTIADLLEILQRSFENASCEEVELETNETSARWATQLWKEEGYDDEQIKEMLQKKTITLFGSSLTQLLIDAYRNPDLDD